MIEKIIFNVAAFTLFILVFLKLIKKNETNYVYFFALQFIGILINFIELILGIEFNIFIRTIMYLLAIILPILLLLLEHNDKIQFTNIVNGLIIKFYDISKKEEKEKQYLISIIEKHPNNVFAHKSLAKLYKKQNKKELELEEYEKIFELDQNDMIIYQKIGNLYKECNRVKEAKQVFEDILNKKPDCYEASMELANILYESESFKEAILVYKSALKYNPVDYNLYYNIAMTYTMLNDFQKAKENYEKAAQINTMLYKAKYHIGQLYLIYGDLEEAKEYFEECINSEEVEGGSYFYLARIALIKGEIEKAENYANIAIECDSTIYEKIIEDDIFIAIMDKVKRPSKNEKNKTLSQEDLEIEKHLYETCKLVGKLNNSDIQMIENVMKTKEKKDNDFQREEQE